MTRAGREPAEDVKRRLVAACEEVGLIVVNASMHLSPQSGARVIHVGASLPGWNYESPTISLMARVTITGQWPDFVDVRCCGTEKNPSQTLGPWMRGRGMVPFLELIEQLRQTLAEREQVIAAAKKGIPGPYNFERSVWAPFDLLDDLS